MEVGLSTLNKVARKKFVSNSENKQGLIRLMKVEFEKKRISTRVSTNSCLLETIKFAKEVGMGGEVPNIYTDEANLLILTIVHLNSYMMLISNHQGTRAIVR